MRKLRLIRVPAQLLQLVHVILVFVNLDNAVRLTIANMEEVRGIITTPHFADPLYCLTVLSPCTKFQTPINYI